MSINPNDLDRWITGNYGEDQFGDEPDGDTEECEDGCGRTDEHEAPGECYTHEDHLADEADRAYDRIKDRDMEEMY